MKIIHCPVNGPRPRQEFHYGGEFRVMPDAATASDEQWADYVFNRGGEPGIKREWWYHVPSGTWFIADRDNRTDTFLRTYRYSADLCSADLCSADLCSADLCNADSSSAETVDE